MIDISMRFEGHYAGWRQSRISKIEKIFGKLFFQNKSILELGAGFGHIGEHFQSLGSRVSFAEGREENVLILKQKFNDVYHLNQNDQWNLNKKFDIVIHWGVLYHLDNWKQDLICALNHSKILLLESEVSDSDDPTFEIKVNEHTEYDQSVNGIGSRPSAQNIENAIINLGFTFQRYDDSDLNYDFHVYDWSVTNSNTWRHGLRRFWIVQAK